MKPNNDNQAFEQLISRHNAVIARICFYYSRSREEYEDLQQDCLINIWRGLPHFRHEAGEATWVYRIALNTCISSLRSRRRNPVDAAMELPETLADNSADPSLPAAMHSLIVRLPPREKAVVLMWLDEMPYEEIAQVMGASRNNVATWIRRAKQKLVKMSNE